MRNAAALDRLHADLDAIGADPDFAAPDCPGGAIDPDTGEREPDGVDAEAAPIGAAVRDAVEAQMPDLPPDARERMAGVVAEVIGPLHDRRADPAMVRVDESRTAADFHRRKMLPIAARSRVDAARLALGDLWPLAFAVIRGAGYDRIAADHGVSVRTVQRRIERAADALARHYAAEDARPPFATWGADHPDWRSTPDGAEVVARCAKAGPAFAPDASTPPGPEEYMRRRLTGRTPALPDSDPRPSARVIHRRHGRVVPAPYVIVHQTAAERVREFWARQESAEAHLHRLLAPDAVLDPGADAHWRLTGEIAVTLGRPLWLPKIEDTEAQRPVRSDGSTCHAENKGVRGARASGPTIPQSRRPAP